MMDGLDALFLEALAYGLIAGGALAGLIFPVALVLWIFDVFTPKKDKP
jgi:hypothetical protein